MKSALVIGCAANVWDDVEAAMRLGVMYNAIYCVKLAGVYYPGKFDVWVTLHPEAMDDYETQRQNLGLPNGYQIVAPAACELGQHGAKGNIARRVSYLWPGAATSASASSGIYGAKVALADGFERVVLAGIPMSPEQGHFKPNTKTVSGVTRGKTWTGHSAFICGFNEAAPHLMGKVKSVSGYTKTVLGGPNASWLAGNEILRDFY